MTDLASLPPSVLLKVATLEQACIGLTTTLEAGRRELQRLLLSRRDCIPEAQPDEFAANRESERVLAEWARLDAAIEAQRAHCERQEQRLRTEEGVIRSCKQYLHGLPSNARLRVVEGRAGDLAGIRERIRQAKDEIAQVKAMPVPSPDLPERIAHYVAKLAVRPGVTGIGEGQTLSVEFPLRADPRNTQVNALLMLAFLDGGRLAARLTEAAYQGSISPTERDKRLHALQQQLIALRYDEEASVCAAIDRDEDVSRSGPAWAVLMVVEHEQQQAAA